MPTQVTYRAPGHHEAIGPGAGQVLVDRPQPGDVVSALAAEQRHDVPPRRHERRRRDMAVAPRVPVSVHLMPEADDHRMAEVPDTVGKRAQVAVVTARRDRGDRGVGRIHLQDRDGPVPADRLRERSREGLTPAAVVPDKVRVPACCRREVGHRLVGMWRPLLVDAQVRGRPSGRDEPCRETGRTVRKKSSATGDGQGERDRSDRRGHEDHPGISWCLVYRKHDPAHDRLPEPKSSAPVRSPSISASWRTREPAACSELVAPRAASRAQGEPTGTSVPK